MEIIKKQINISTGKKTEFYEITNDLRAILTESGIQEGIATIFIPHTTGGIIINENADLDVLNDLEIGFNTAFPDNPKFKHMEGNTTSHLKAISTGSSETVFINNGRLNLGAWQGVFFAEFDGPRNRKILIQIIGN